MNKQNKVNISGVSAGKYIPLNRRTNSDFRVSVFPTSLYLHSLGAYLTDICTYVVAYDAVSEETGKILRTSRTIYYKRELLLR